MDPTESSARDRPGERFRWLLDITLDMAAYSLMICGSMFGTAVRHPVDHHLVCYVPHQPRPVLGAWNVPAG